MEVHSHNHGNAEHHTHKKKWSIYVWEFLMLFLAVFCGFLAENIREHVMERSRAKVFAGNLYKELQVDTFRLREATITTRRLISRYDTLCVLAMKKGTPSGMLYYYSNYVASFIFFNSNTSTLEQLKSSGNQRLLTSEIALKISDYDRNLKLMENDNSFFRTEYETINGLRLKIFDGIIAEQIGHYPDRVKNRDSVFILNLPLVNDDPKLMKEFLGWVKVEGSYWDDHIISFLEPIRKKAEELIALLKKEYRLD